MSSEILNIRDCRNGNWYFVDNKLIKEYGRILGPHGIAVYNVLAMYSNSETQQANPSFKTIADTLGMSRRHVIRMVELLQKYNLVHVQKKTGISKTGNPIHLPSIVTLLKPDEWITPDQSVEGSDYTQGGDSESLVTDSHQGGSDSESQGVVTDSHINNTNNNKTKKEKIDKSLLEPATPETIWLFEKINENRKAKKWRKVKAFGTLEQKENYEAEFTRLGEVEAKKCLDWAIGVKGILALDKLLPPLQKWEGRTIAGHTDPIPIVRDETADIAHQALSLAAQVQPIYKNQLNAIRFVSENGHYKVDLSEIEEEIFNSMPLDRAEKIRAVLSEAVEICGAQLEW